MLVAACSGGEASKYAAEGEGPMSVRARNSLAAQNPAGLVEVGEGFERTGNLQGAARLYAQAMAADPDLIEAQVAFARITVKLGQPERGTAMLTALIGRHPENTEVRRALTETHLAVGNFEAARLFFEPILTGGSATAGDFVTGGKMAEIAGDSVQSRELFDKALSLAPNSPEVLENLALSFALDGDYAAAVGILQRSMDQATGLISGKTVLATVYALSGQLDGAVQLARGAMPLEEANKRVIFYQLLPRLNRQEQAEAVFFNRIPKDALARLSGHASK